LDIAHEGGAAEVFGAPKGDTAAFQGEREEEFHGVEQAMDVTKEKCLMQKKDRMEKKEGAKQ
jgi:hypothetical protein